MVSSLDRIITDLLPRIKYGGRGLFYDVTFSVADHFLQLKNLTPVLSRTKFLCAGAGSWLGFGLFAFGLVRIGV